MTNFIQSDSGVLKSTLIGAVLLCMALLLAGCSEPEINEYGEYVQPSARASSPYEVPGDHAIGNPNAAVTVVEYASVVCGACANWHTTVYPDFKQKYIDSGKVRFIFREFPTSPETLARTGFLIANCADETKFFENISLQFKRQTQIFKASSNGTVRQEYVNLAKSAGLSEAEFIACLQDEQENARYDAVVQGGIDAGVTGTPSFFINGEKVQRTPTGAQLFRLEAFDEVLEPLLAEAAANGNQSLTPGTVKKVLDPVMGDTSNEDDKP